MPIKSYTPDSNIPIGLSLPPKPNPKPKPPPVKKDHFSDDYARNFRHGNKTFIIRIYANEGDYNADLIDEIVFKASHIRDDHGNIVLDFRSDLEEFIHKIDKNGYTKRTDVGLSYYPPHRIHLIEVVDDPVNDD